MARGLGLSFGIVFGDVAKVMDEHKAVLSVSALEAMTEAVDTAKVEGRADIARAGFSRRWQNALRGTVYPNPDADIGPSGTIHHQIGYAGIFEDGGTIMGDPMLWLPFDTTAKKVDGKKMTPSRFPAPLVSMKSRNGLPMLGAAVRLSAAKAAQTNPRVTLSTIRKGVAEVGPKGRKRQGVVRLIPMFFGIKSVDIPKKISIRQIVEKANNRMSEFFAKALARNLGGDD